jgi:signal transduction histidine kinase
MGRPEAPFSYIFASELHGRLLWFARLRWFAVAVLAATAFAGPRLGWAGVWPGLAIIAGFVAAYNLVFLHRLRGVLLWESHYRNLRAAAIQHMLADLGSLLVVVHFTGGCHSPALPFVVFHMAIGTIMISTRVMYLLAALTSAGAIALFTLEAGGILAGHPTARPAGAFASSCLVSAAVLMVLVFGMVYLTDTVTSRFKHRGIQLYEASEKLREGKEQLQELLREREQVERRKSHYMRISAHQLRSPLGTIQTSLRVLLDGIVDPASEGGRRLIAGASERVDDLLSIVNDLLELAKMHQPGARRHLRRHRPVRPGLRREADARHRRRRRAPVGGAARPRVRVREPDPERHQVLPPGRRGDGQAAGRGPRRVGRGCGPGHRHSRGAER